MGWFSNFILSAGGIKVLEAEDIKPDTSESNIGIHLYSNYGEEYEFISPEVSKDTVRKLINDLDWESNFFQVICTLEPGKTMEVGGSLNGLDGLSAVFINRQDNIESVIVNPLSTREEMNEVMQSYILGTRIWYESYNWS